jgi:hypothetical protein
VNANDLLTLGLGLTEPWKVVGQKLDVNRWPSELRLAVEADRGVLYPCPTCGKLCKAHDFMEFSWRHLNFFQHHYLITARVPRVNCPDHGLRRVQVPWAREGSGFTLLFEQAVMIFAREMPVNAVARYVSVTDKRIWLVVTHYVFKAMGQIDLSGLCGVGLDETVTKRRHHYVTVFVDMDRDTRPVIFATPGKGKACFKEFAKFLKQREGNPDNVIEVVCDMSCAFLAAAEETFSNAAVTVDWFHVVQIFIKALDEVKRLESKEVKLPKGARWAVLKGMETWRNEEQLAALEELKERGLAVDGNGIPREGVAALGAQCRNQTGGTLAGNPIFRVRPGTCRGFGSARNGSQGAEYVSRAFAENPEALGVPAFKRTPGRTQWPLPGRSFAGQGLPERDHLHHYDLPDRGTHRRTSGRKISTVNVEDPTTFSPDVGSEHRWSPTPGSDLLSRIRTAGPLFFGAELSGDKPLGTYISRSVDLF